MNVWLFVDNTSVAAVYTRKVALFISSGIEIDDVLNVVNECIVVICFHGDLRVVNPWF